MRQSGSWTICVFLAPFILGVGLYLLVISPAIQRADRRERGELAALRMMEDGLRSYVAEEGRLPTNWLSLTNAIKWDYVIPWFTSNGLPEPTKLYTILNPPLNFRNVAVTGSIVMVRSQPVHNWPRESRRWYFVVGDFPGRAPYPYTNGSNQIFRMWSEENHLPPELRAIKGNVP
jgi:hypothetical protein